MKKIVSLGILALCACGPTVKTVSVEPGQAMMSYHGASLTLRAAVKDENGQAVPNMVISWTSSNPAAAAVDGSGKVWAVNSGAADITATAGKIKGVAHIKVQIPGSLTVEPGWATLSPGQATKLNLVIKDEAGNVINGVPAVPPGLPGIFWVSSNSSVAAVDNVGNVQAHGNGGALITAHLGAVTGTASITVTLPRFDKLEIVMAGGAKSPLSMMAGATNQLAVRATLGGKPVAGVIPTYSISDARVATITPTRVSPDGFIGDMLHAIKPGRASVTAIAGDEKAHLELAVK